MTQFAKLSKESERIVRTFCKSQIKSSAFCEPNKQLMVSLYARTSDYNRGVINILNEYLVELDTLLSPEDLDLLMSEYSAVVQLCYKLSNYGGIFHKHPNVEFIPTSLLELCQKLVEVKEKKNVLLPFSGDAAFTLGIRNCEIEGFELNQTQWALSQILLGSTCNKFNISCSDIVDVSSQYDCIFSFPPLLHNRTEERKVINFFCDVVSHALTHQGELCCILPKSFCNASSGWFDFRKTIVDHQKELSILVIDLPSSLFPYAGIPFCLVNVSKDYQGTVTLVDASDESFLSRTDVAGAKEFFLKSQSLLESIQHRDEKYVWNGNFEGLSGGYSLQPSRYLISQHIPTPNQGEKVVALSDIVDIVPITDDVQLRQMVSRRNRLVHAVSEGIFNEEAAKFLDRFAEMEKQSSVPLIGMKELSNSYQNCELSIKDFGGKKALPTSFIAEDCLLAGFIGGKFKVARTHGISPSCKVAVRKEVFPIKLKNNLISEDYLLRCLMSDMVTAQADCLASGTTISRLATADFLSIKILVPSLAEQERLFKEDTRSSLSEADRKLLESFEEFRNDMHMKTHAIGQTIYNFNNWWKILQRVRKAGHGIVDDATLIGDSDPIPVSEVYNNLQDAINKLQQQIFKFDRGNGLAVTKFALTEFIESYIARNRSPRFSYIYDGSKHHADKDIPVIDFDEVSGDSVNTGEFVIRKGDPIEFVDFASDALTIVFDNIVSNACSHGFEGREEGNFIKIDLFSEGDDYVISIANNGAPLHEQISEEDVFTYAKSSQSGNSLQSGNKHYGIGGYEVKKLMREFGGDVIFVANPDSEFPITYKLIFHNTNIVDSIDL